MTPAEFKTKWAKVTAKETSAYVEHFNDLCRMLRLPTPLEADPTGSEFFCFQKHVVKDAELFSVAEPDEEGKLRKHGFADVWKRGCFGWEYKGLHKNLDAAYQQLLQYREALLNPPLLVVCDFKRFIIKTNFNGTVQEVHEFTNAQIDDPKNLALLRAVITDPDFLKPQRTTAQVTETLAGQIAEVAKSLQKRESAELTDAQTRAEANFAQRKNLRIARFLNRIVFCLFAEDTRLLPGELFTDILKAATADPAHFAKTLEELFRVMATGGSFGQHKIRHFNGHLFEDATVFELNEDELRILGDAASADWQFIEPSILGTLFERALEPEQRSQLGAHYTSEADILTLVEPVLMAPLRREWDEIKQVEKWAGEKVSGTREGKSHSLTFTPAHLPAAERRKLRGQLEAFQRRLANVTVLDPACGSGNFLYVSLRRLLDLEKEVVTFATQLGFSFKPQVSVQQLKAIEINPYAFELAQVSVQVGFLQWRRDNGFDNDRTPVLQNLDGFQNEDALLVPHYRNKAKSLKEAQAGEHAGDDALKFYTERDWPKCDVIVGNPPFLGGSRLWEELGRHYQQELWKTYDGRVPGFADLCCYWFEKARQQIESGKCQRVGLLATQAIRGGANRDVLNRIKNTGGIFFAESSREWVLAGAAVNVSMVGFDNGTERDRLLDGRRVTEIQSNLGSDVDLVSAKSLQAMETIAFIGTKKAGKFELDDKTANELLALPNPHGLPNSDVIRPWLDGFAIVKRPSFEWIIDCGLDMAQSAFAAYESPYARAFELVKPDRDKNNRKLYREKWWLHAETRPGMRRNCLSLPRYLATVCHSKHRLFVWANSINLPDGGVFTFARADDLFFGVLHSRLHEVWALKQGTHLEDRPRYTPSTCFETFPFPHPTPAQKAAIAAAARELNALRERWLNPPEWTETRTLEFPGSVTGPWARYVDATTVNAQTGIGTVRYSRLEPRDADSAAKLKKRTLTNLYNERPAWLDLAHRKLDAAVAAGYGFPADLSGEQILERLLALNLERAAEEAKAAKVKKPKTSRAKEADELI